MSSQRHHERRYRSDGPPDGGSNRGEHRGRRSGGRGGPRGHGGGGRGFGSRGGWQQADLPSADDAAAWLVGRLPDEWFVGGAQITVDREEIVVVGELAPPAEGNADDNTLTEDSTESGAAGRAAAQGRIGRFREQTRQARMAISDEAESRYGRKVAWGATIGETRELFTQLAVPVMTRLRHDERRVLDTLVDSGVARSRSDALVWCVRLVGEHTGDWLAGLREAMSEVDKVRAEGPHL